MEFPFDESEGGVPQAGADEVLEVLAPEVAVASLTAFGEGGVVVFQAVDGTVIGHADEEGASVG